MKRRSVDPINLIYILGLGVMLVLLIVALAHANHDGTPLSTIVETKYLLVIRGEAVNGYHGMLLDTMEECRTIETQAKEDTGINGSTGCIEVIIRPKGEKS